MLQILTTLMNDMTTGGWVWLTILVALFMVMLYSGMQFFENLNKEVADELAQEKAYIEALHTLPADKQDEIYTALIIKDKPTDQDKKVLARLAEIKTTSSPKIPTT